VPNCKQTIIALLAAVNLAILVLWSQTGSRCRTKLTVGAAAVTFISSFALGTLSYYEHRYAIKPSDILALFLFSTLLFDAAQCRTLWLIKCHSAISELFSAAVGLKAIIFVVECYEKRTLLVSYFKESTREQTSGLLSHASSYWLGSLLWTGKNQ
jgi:ATP-binding cassette subfamily C (CFTR/MRP) protein 1